jgi:hypothetical protein
MRLTQRCRTVDQSNLGSVPDNKYINGKTPLLAIALAQLKGKFATGQLVIRGLEVPLWERFKKWYSGA